MSLAEPAHLLHYKISTDSEGVNLCIWELAHGLEHKRANYLYIINCRATSIEEAKQSLRYHLNLNGGLLTNDQDIPIRGHVRLMPYPTLEYE